MILEISNIIALGYFYFSLDSIGDTIEANRFSPIKYIKSIIECSKCYSFWVVFIFSGDIVGSLLVSLCVLLMESFITTKL